MGSEANDVYLRLCGTCDETHPETSPYECCNCGRPLPTPHLAISHQNFLACGEPCGILLDTRRIAYYDWANDEFAGPEEPPVCLNRSHLERQ